MIWNKRYFKTLVIVLLLIFITQSISFAEPNNTLLDKSMSLLDVEQPEDFTFSLQILLLLTILTLAPSILIMMTSFTRIIIVLSFIRNALGTQQTPPNQVLIGLALFLTFFIMSPIAAEIYDTSLQPYLNEEISEEEFLSDAITPIREFMFAQTRDKDLALFVEVANMQNVEKIQDIPTTVLIPAFIISELKTAFQIGFILFIPFLVIDMVVASTLMSMGMMMLPPVMISLPFKLLLFVMVDGWNLITRALVTGF